MKISIKTHVASSLEKVKFGFNESLFKSLNPPFPKATVQQFDGSKTGDTVSLELNFLLFKQAWISEITDHEDQKDSFYFIDEGKQLPFFLKRWKHKHILSKHNNGTNIVDEINYSTWNRVTDILFYPFLLAQFIYRKPIYKRIFGQN